LRIQRIGVESAAMGARVKTAKTRAAVAVLVAVFALLIQALTPAAAMAARSDGAGGMVICTGDGTATLTADGHLVKSPPSKPKGFAGMPCQDCLALAMTAIVTPQPTILRVAYTAALVEHAPVRQLFPPRARGPPRPFGQGPPTA
jgi:hypothetical protein